MTGHHGRAGIAALLAAVLPLTGCASSQDEAARATAGDFRAAVAAGDGAAACTLLSPRARAELEQSASAPCARAVLEEDLPTTGAVGDVRVFGTMARVGSGVGTVFLSRFDAGWRVVAAGCAPTSPDHPYDCRVEG